MGASNSETSNVLEKSSSKHKKRREPYKEVKRDAPENPHGIYIQHADASKQEPRDFLLIARVVKRNTRPLTIAEVQHQQRQNVLFKLDNEIRDLQKQSGYERNVSNTQKLLRNLTEAENCTGPMCVALAEYERRKISNLHSMKL